jgi:hypothetical protein
MKKIFIIILMAASIPVTAQISSVFAVDSVEYKIGDKIKMGKATDGLPEFSYILRWVRENVSTLEKPKNPAIDSLQIVSITKNEKWSDFNVECKMMVTGTDFYYTYSIIFNKAIETGEIKSKRPDYFVAPTSKQALEALKKAKEKVDLGLMTQEEYNLKMEELKKYIKD